MLAQETGHQRDYSEGAAYRDYFSTDHLMFTVPKTDSRLRNKAEVLVMRLESVDAGRWIVPVAIASDFLKRRPVFQTEVAGRWLVVLTTRGGANRVYDAGSHRFAQNRDDAPLVDEHGRRWRITEDALIAEEPHVQTRPRLAAQRAFWFGWQAQFPETVLIK